MSNLLINILIASAASFVAIVIFSEIILYFKRKKINSSLEDSIKEEIFSIKRENKSNRVYLTRIEKMIAKLSTFIYNHQLHRTMQYFVQIEQDYQNLSEAYRRKINLRLFEICCGLFDELFKFEMYLSASKVYRFMHEDLYKKGNNREREIMFSDINTRFNEINKFLSASRVYKFMLDELREKDTQEERQSLLSDVGKIYNKLSNEK
ncbi:MAG TPA: hypothetical protein ENN46_04825 [Candidatus Woesearchaeota archaeon]|nr:hypothetical protein [Candidatus Woesearchaeota archaeon]